MNDEETVALDRRRGHTFGKYPRRRPGVSRRRAIRKPPTGSRAWLAQHLRHRRRQDAITSGLEVTRTTTPTQWNHDFFRHLFEYEWG